MTKQAKVRTLIADVNDDLQEGWNLLTAFAFPKVKGGIVYVLVKHG